MQVFTAQGETKITFITTPELPVAVLLGGWSEGPLLTIQRHFQGKVEFFYPSIPTPPVGIRWCWNPWFFSLFLSTGLFCALFISFVPHWTSSGWVKLLFRVTLLVGFFLLCRLQIALLVKASINQSVSKVLNLCLEKKRESQPAHPIVLVGFSWGACVIAAMVEQRLWDGPALLLAPPIFAVGRVTRSAPAMLPNTLFPSNSASLLLHEESANVCIIDEAKEEKEKTNNKATQVIVIHPTMDPVFCPAAQIDHFRQFGAKVISVRDNHVMLNLESTDRICAAVNELLWGK